MTRSVHGVNIATVLRQGAERRRHGPAIIQSGTALLTYGEFQDRTAKFAGALAERGVIHGDRVLVCAANSADYLTLLFACWHVGACVVPVNSRLNAIEVAAIADDCDARWLFLDSQAAAGFASRRHVTVIGSLEFARFEATNPARQSEVQPDDPAWLFYTSGTTGRSKGAILTHRNLLAMSLSFLADSGAAHDDAVLHLAPLSHASGLMAIPYVLRGLPHVLLGESGMTRPGMSEALNSVSKASFFAVPTVVNRLISQGLIPLSLVNRVHRIFFGGAAMYVSDLRRAIAHFGMKRLWHLYGQGEAPITISYYSPEMRTGTDSRRYEERLASVGVARSGVEVRVVGADHEVLPAKTAGEIEVRGDVVMAGYWNNASATASAMHDGWLCTGDIGWLDEEGFLTLTDRSKDVIISGGSNIYPREIEEVLLADPAVAECAVIGVPHEKWGEVPVAFVVRTALVDEKALEQRCLASLARFKRPHGYRFVEELPKSGHGKVLKRELIARFGNPLTGTT